MLTPTTNHTIYTEVGLIPHHGAFCQICASLKTHPLRSSSTSLFRAHFSTQHTWSTLCQMWVCLENGVYLSNRHFHEENGDKPVDVEAPHFQTNTDIYIYLIISYISLLGAASKVKKHLDQLFLASSGSNASSIQYISGKKRIRTPSGMHRPMITANYRVANYWDLCQARICPLWDIQREHFGTGTLKRWFTVTNRRRFKKHGMKLGVSEPNNGCIFWKEEHDQSL